tara:strand:- start:133 stop:702 length:570 start_codon:yes stop_codon:yes gene_type:complete
MVALTTGTPNTAIGENCASADTTAYNNVTIGHDASSTSAASGNQFTMGNSTIDNLRCNDTSISSLSDERDKAQIEDYPEDGGLEFINKLRPRTFYWDRREWYDNGTPDGSKIKSTHREWKSNSGQRMGFISQEVKTAIDGFKFMEDSRVVSGTPEKLEFAPAHLITPLIKAVQQLSAEVESLKAQLEES